MAHAVIIRKLPFPEKFQNCFQNNGKISVRDPAAVNRYNIMKTSPFVHAEGQFSSLYLITKGIFHLIAVTAGNGAWQNAVINQFLTVFFENRLHQIAYLFFLQLQLGFIGNALIQTSAAASKMSAYMFRTFQRRTFQYLKKPSFCLSVSCFFYGKADFLTGKRLLYRHISILHMAESFIRKINSLYNRFKYLAFFHTFLPESPFPVT